MASIDVHPSELAYAFSYAKVKSLVGWGSEPFLPSGDKDGDPANWYNQGEERLVAAGRLVGTADAGLNFTDDMASDVLALVNPGIVLLAQRKAGNAVRVLTVHAAGARFVGLTRRPDGMFELTHYADLTAAAGACAGFVGAVLAPLASEARIETDHESLSGLKRLASADRMMAPLMKLGVTEPEARSAALALASPMAAGVVSVLYCQANVVEDAETISVMTNAQDQTWIIFAPAGPNGPVILERSSVSALTARISVGVVARLGGGA